MLSLANGISLARIVLVLVLILVKPLSITFFTIYLVCGISDVLDGYVARKTNTVSSLGGKLDSVADLIMVLVVCLLLCPYVWPGLANEIIVWIVIIGLIRLFSLLVVRAKHKTFEILHTYGNKATGILLFVSPFFLAYGNININLFAYILCGVASMSALEELWIHLSSRDLQAEKKSIFRD